jgi:alpha-glucosidase
VGDLYWPVATGRDGCRTPMPWRPDAPNLGFSTGLPWLPAAPEHAGLTVAAQEADPASTLAFARALVAQRKTSAALTAGDLELWEAPAPLFVFERRAGDEAVLCAFNLGDQPARLDDGRLQGGAVLAVGTGGGALLGQTLELGPHAARFIRLGHP